MTGGADWPAGLAPYKRTPEFNEVSLPAGLRRAHSTKAGVWAALHVLSGRLVFCDEETGRRIPLDAGVHRLIRPEAPHHVEPVGAVRFFVEFYGRPEG